MVYVLSFYAYTYVVLYANRNMNINTIKTSNRLGEKMGFHFSDFHTVPLQGFLKTFSGIENIKTRSSES